MTRKYSSAPLGGGSILGTTTPAETLFPQNREGGNDSFLKKVGANSKVALTTAGTFAALFAANSAASTIGFTQSSYSVAENDRYAGIGIKQTCQPGEEPGLVSVSYATSNGTANEEEDYRVVEGTLTWDEDSCGTTQTFDVPIYDDSEYEGNETINLSLNNGSTATLGIIEDDSPLPPVFKFTQSYSVDENSSYATIGVRMTCPSGVLNDSASVSYSSSNGTAEEGEDYSAVEGKLTWDTWGASGNCGITKTFEVPIHDDSKYEGNETVNLKLGDGDTTTLIIVSDDPYVPPVIDFSSSDYYHNEGQGNAVVDVIMICPSGVNLNLVSVLYSSNDTAMAVPSVTSEIADSSNDYTAVNGTLTWGTTGGCDTIQTFEVPIHDDSRYEKKETINLSLSGGFVKPDSGKAVLNIYDDDPTFAFSPLEYDFLENAGHAKIGVKMTCPSNIVPNSASVSYSSSDDGTAMKGEDYDAVNGTLTWDKEITWGTSGSCCDTTQTFELPIHDDLKVEENETVNLSLSGNVLSPSDGTVILNILDNDPIFDFSPSQYNLIEDGGRAEISVKMTCPSGKMPDSASVLYASSNGTATAGSDYTAVSGELKWGADSCGTTKTFQLPIRDDLNDEENETINLSLSNPSGELGSSNRIVLTIGDDEEAPVAIMSVDPTFGIAPLTVTANGNNSSDPDGYISSYKWTVSDGQNASSSQASFVFNQGGLYNISLEVTDNDELTSTTVQQIVDVNTRPTAKLSTNPTEGKSPLTVTLNGSQSFDSDDDAIVRYAWTASDGQTKVGQTAKMTFVEPGTYTISLVVTDDKNDNSSNTANQIVTVSKKQEVRPIARLVALPMVGEAPLMVRLEGGESYDPDGNVVSYEWIASDGQRADQQQAEMTFNTQGDYKITLIVTDDDGLQSTEAWRTIKVNKGGGTPPVAIFEELPASGQAPLTMDLNASESYDPDGKIVSYEWTASNGQTTLTDSGSNASLNFEQIGNYTVMLTVTDDEGLKDTANQTITITEEDVDIVRVELAGLNESYAVGDTVIVDLVEKVNTNRFNRVDLWVAIQIPSGELLFFTPLALAPFSLNSQPFKKSLESTSKTTRLLDFEVIPGLGGTYTFYALYVEEGKNPMNHLENLGVVQRSSLVTQTITLASK